MSELKACPFCNTDAERSEMYGGDNAYSRLCLQCKMAGPIGKTKQEADELWNARVEDRDAEIGRLVRELMQKDSAWCLFGYPESEYGPAYYGFWPVDALDYGEAEEDDLASTILGALRLAAGEGDL